MNKSFLYAALLSICCILSPTTQATEFSLKDMQAGILDVNSDQFEFDNLKGTILYSGNVVVILGDRQLLCDELILYRNLNGEGKITKIIAKGDPAHLKGTLKNQLEIIDAYAQTMEYNAEKAIFYLRGDARVIRGTDVYKAPEIQYDVANEIISSSSSARERTHITIDPKNLKKINHE